jgi:hypothetical protein
MDMGQSSVKRANNPSPVMIRDAEEVDEMLLLLLLCCASLVLHPLFI